MSNISVAIHGLGNIGGHLIDCISTANDIHCLGLIRRKESIGKNQKKLDALDEFSSIEDLIAAKGKPDAVILGTPSRTVLSLASSYLQKGINTVDSFDIHSSISELVQELGAEAKKHKAVAISAAGWDPGTDSVFRALFEAMAPIGTTFTNFGRGRSMGHSVAARSLEGVENATAITIPLGGGRHSRLVYLLLKKGQNLEKIKNALGRDPYFSHDELEVREVKSQMELDVVADKSHGVFMERIGASGTVSNQHLNFDMRINNPALTAQVLVSCARASTRLSAGCYTLIDIPPVMLLPGDRMDNIQRLV